MISRKDKRDRCKERGGIVILVALMLLTLLSVAAFSLGRTVIREIGISGNVYQAGRADASADAGLDWFIAWENETVQGRVVPGTAARALAITDAVNAIAYGDSGLSLADKSSHLSYVANVTAKDGMVLQGHNTDGSMTQAFDIQMVFLGPDNMSLEGGGETNAGNPTGGTGLDRNNIVNAWEITSTGQALLPDDAWRYRSVRSAKITLPPTKK